MDPQSGGGGGGGVLRPRIYPSGAIIWVPHATEVWKKAEVLSSTDRALTVRYEEGVDEAGRSEAMLDPARVETHMGNEEQFSAEGLRGPDDLTLLTHLHEPALLHSLNLRFDVDQIYTYTGPILLAVNPFKTIQNMYSVETIKSFLKHSEEEGGLALKRLPHVFSTGAIAFRNMCKLGSSQTILISGESGAGKTESTKFVMKLLALAGTFGKKAKAAGNRARSNSNPIENQVLQSNPLLEALGNAKTLRNNNSSRFGKFIEMQFALTGPPGADGTVGRLAGARIHTYLLERVRVCHQAEGERNFHVFYQVCAAAAEAAKNGGVVQAGSNPARQTGSSAASQAGANASGAGAGSDSFDFSLFASYENFAYLTQSSCFSLGRTSDLDEFRNTVAAMQTVGIAPAEQAAIFNVIAAVLYLCNVEFDGSGGEGAAVVIPPGGRAHASFRLAARLLRLKESDLMHALTIRTLVARGETYKIPLKQKEAEDTRDALAKALYGTLFLKVVQRTNESIGYRKDVSLFCGVLDIFGFECFEVNSFEQLCINFTNERLQQFFNNFIFSCEEELYRREGIPWSALDFPDNEDCVSLMDHRTTGIFASLDEECLVPGGNDRAFCNKMKERYGATGAAANARFGVTKTKPEWFIVHHFAGPVGYCSTGFLDKNRDQLSADAQETVKGSADPFVQSLFVEFLNRGGPAAGGGAGPAAAGPAAAGGSSNSLSAVEKSGAGGGGGGGAASGGSSRAASGARAAGPSGGGGGLKKKALISVSSEFRQQLNYLMGTVAITDPHFVRCLKPNPRNRPDEFHRRSVTEQLRYAGVLQAVQVSRAGYPVRVSHAEVVLDYQALCDAAGRAALAAAADSAAARAKALLQHLDAKFRFPQPLHAACSWAVGHTLVFLKHEAYAVLATERAALRARAAVRLQAAWRGNRQARAYAVMREATIMLQAAARGMLARRLADQVRRTRAATKMQAAARGFAARRWRRARLADVRAIQAAFRGFVARRSVATLRRYRAAAKIQAHWRGFCARTRMQKLRRAARLAQLRWRGILAKRQLRRLRQEQREVGALLAEKQRMQTALRAAVDRCKEQEGLLLAVQADRDGLHAALEEARAQLAAAKKTLADQQARFQKHILALSAGGTPTAGDAPAGAKAVSSGAAATGGEGAAAAAPATSASPRTPSTVSPSSTLPPDSPPKEERRVSAASVVGGKAAKDGGATAGGAGAGGGDSADVRATAQAVAQLESALRAKKRAHEEAAREKDQRIAELDRQLTEARALHADLEKRREQELAAAEKRYACLLKSQTLSLPTHLRGTAGAAADPAFAARAIEVLVLGPERLKAVLLGRAPASSDNSSDEAAAGSTTGRSRSPASARALAVASAAQAAIFRSHRVKRGGAADETIIVGELSEAAQREPDQVREWAQKCRSIIIVYDASHAASFEDAAALVTVTDSHPNRVLYGYRASEEAAVALSLTSVRDFAARHGATATEGSELGPVLDSLWSEWAEAAAAAGGGGGGGIRRQPSLAAAPLLRHHSSTVLGPGSLTAFMSRLQSFFTPTDRRARGEGTGAPQLVLRDLSEAAGGSPSGGGGAGGAAAASGGGALGSQIRPVSEVNDRASAVTCLVFGQEKQHEKFYLMAASSKDGGIRVYRIWRTPGEVAEWRRERAAAAGAAGGGGEALAGVAGGPGGEPFSLPAGIPAASFTYTPTGLGEAAFSPCASPAAAAASSGGEGGSAALLSSPRSPKSPLGFGSVERYLELFGHTRAVTHMLFSFKEDQLISTSIDKSVRFWSLTTGDMLKVFADSTPCLVAAYLPFNPALFVVGNSNAMLRLVDCRNGVVLQKLKAESEVRALHFDYSGLYCFGGTRSGVLHALETMDDGTLQFRFRIKLARASITCIALAPQTSAATPALFVNTCDSTVSVVSCIYKMPSGALTSVVVKHRLRIAQSLLPLRCCFSSAGPGWVISASEDKHVYVYSADADSGYKQILLKQHDVPVVTVAVNKMSSLLVSGDSVGRIVLWRQVPQAAAGVDGQRSLSKSLVT